MAARWQSKRLLQGINAIVGGQGPPVVLVAGWPQTAEAYGDIFESLSKHHQFFALDPPGLGESAPSTNGYDTATISKTLAESLNEVIKEPYHLVGHDVGGWIAYPWAAQFPSKIKSLSILDAAVPGLAPPQQFPLSNETNLRLWQFSFNALPELPEILTQGRERELLTWFFNLKVAHPEKFPKERLESYIQSYARPGAMSRGFEYYRAVERSSKQNIEFTKKPLNLPVLALGGSKSVGANMVRLAQTLGSNVQGGAIEDCGHFVAEEQPDEVARKLLEFFKHVDEKH
ncbi:alpha/beta fold hydrolase [Aspergillus affinis]|uniref:alpha/beta fold hydrolase n=1 Tax=Aspergillus affinis TaxID=1070780 RepID=UPI0022FE006F|nr:alpha/beta-hydrolase [Aspergillus affinis]KAI9045061.1 alpha/beta-hydrolase [Aspergillus affinis]